MNNSVSSVAKEKKTQVKKYTNYINDLEVLTNIGDSKVKFSDISLKSLPPVLLLDFEMSSLFT